jgi:hypothetical protein
MSVDVKNFQKTLTYTATASSRIIFQDLGEIAKIDKEIKKKKSQTLPILIIGIFVIFVSLALLGLSDSFAALGIILLIGFVIAAITGIITVITGVIFVIRYGSWDISNYRHELSKKVLSLLNRDRNGKTDVNINLILSPPTQKNKRVSTSSHPTRPNWKVEIFRDQWLNLEGEFLDGTCFKLTLTEVYRTASGWKRSTRGKSKHKSKTKSKGSEITLKLNYSQRQYGAIKVLKQEARGAIKLPEQAIMTRLSVTDKVIILKVKVSPNISENQEALYQTISMMFLSLYQILSLAKILSKKKKA